MFASDRRSSRCDIQHQHSDGSWGHDLEPAVPHASTRPTTTRSGTGPAGTIYVCTTCDEEVMRPADRRTPRSTRAPDRSQAGSRRQPQKRRTTSYRTGRPEPQRVERDPLVDAVEPLEEALVGVEPERREAVGRRARRARCALASVANGRHDRERDRRPGRGRGGSRRAMSHSGPSAGASTGAPQTMQLDVARGAAGPGPRRALDLGAHRPARSCRAGRGSRPR